MVYQVMASAGALPWLAVASGDFEWGTKIESFADPKQRVHRVPLLTSRVKTVVVVLNSDSLLL
jgi:hypothetical protein